MKTTNWNYGPRFPLAPIQVHEPEEMRVKVRDECGHERWVDAKMAPIGFRPAAEHNKQVRSERRAKKGKKRGR